MNLCSDSLWPLLAFTLEDSIFLNKMTAVGWLVFHSSFLAKSGKPYLSPFPLNLAAERGSSICAWSHEQQNTYSIYSPDSPLKDLGLCQQGTKPHFQIFSAAAKGMMPSLTYFSQVQMEERPKALPSSFPSLLTGTAFKDVGDCFGQPF